MEPEDIVLSAHEDGEGRVVVTDQDGRRIANVETVMLTQNPWPRTLTLQVNVTPCR